MNREPTRLDDERLLLALRMRDAGRHIATIARRCGFHSEEAARGALRGVDAGQEFDPTKCKVCGAGLRHDNTSGVCRRHNHLRPFCDCKQCRERTAA